MAKNPSLDAMLADIDVADVATAVSPTINALSGEFVHAASRVWVLRRWILIAAAVCATIALVVTVLRRRSAGGSTSAGETTD